MDYLVHLAILQRNQIVDGVLSQGFAELLKVAQILYPLSVQVSYVKGVLTFVALLSVSPTTGLDTGATTILVSSSVLPVATKLLCKFLNPTRGATYANATAVNSTTVSCITPASLVSSKCQIAIHNISR